MTGEKVKSVLQRYLNELTMEANRRARFPGQSYQSPRQFSENESRQHFTLPPPGELPHLRFMCREAQRFVDEGQLDKAMRWLGFLQGVFWARGFYSLDDLKNHSRSETPT